ncbi:MAG: cold shock domain-containing protein [Pseudomonadota bacterium]
MTDERNVRGVVKWFDLSKGFGFVIAEGVSQDILLHVNVVRRFGRTDVTAGDTVTISYDETPRGLQATELVEVVESAGEREGAVQVSIDPSEDLKAARLKWFDKSKGYGFVNVFGDPEDVFVHVDVLRAGGLLDAQVGEAVCVVVTRGAKGASATAIYPWDSGALWASSQSDKG